MEAIHTILLTVKKASRINIGDNALWIFIAAGDEGSSIVEGHCDAMCGKEEMDSGQPIKGRRPLRSQDEKYDTKKRHGIAG